MSTAPANMLRLSAQGQASFSLHLPDVGSKIQQNALRLFWEEIEQRYGVADRFELIVNSARLGVAKPERAIYEETLRRLGVRPAEYSRRNSANTRSR